MNLSVLRRGSTRLHLPRSPLWRGLTLALLDCGVGVATAGILKLLLPAHLWGSAVPNRLEGAPAVGVFLAAILLAPLCETFLAQLLPIEILRRCKAGPTWCILVSGALFGLGHFYSGGIAHGTVTAACGTVLAYAYVSMRKDGMMAAYVCAAVAHAGNNALLIYLVVPFFPS